MKIIIIGPLPPTRGGIAGATHEFCTLLGESNTVIGLSFKRLYPSILFAHSRMDEKKEKLSYEKREWVDALNPLNWWNVSTFIRREKPDRVFFVWWTTYLFPCYFFINLLIRGHTTTAAMIHNVFPHGVKNA